MADFVETVKATAVPGSLLFGFITDVHCQQGADRTGYGATSLEHLADFARRGRACGAEFLVCGGDLVNGNCPKTQTVMELHEAGEAMRSSGLPSWFIIGNHDDNTYYCRAAPSTAIDGMTGAEWEEHVYNGCYPPGMVHAEHASNTYYFDLPEHKLRILVLNNIDLPFAPRPDGSLKYYTINDHGFSRAQLEFVAQRALDFSQLPASEEWALVVMSHMGLDFLPNGGAMLKLFHAFQRGGRDTTGPDDVKACPFDARNSKKNFPSAADPADLVHEVSCDFTRQGARELIAHIYGHEHVDEVRRDYGFVEISLLNSLCYQNHPHVPERRIDTDCEDAQSFIVIDRANRVIRVLRHGAGEHFSAPY